MKRLLKTYWLAIIIIISIAALVTFILTHHPKLSYQDTIKVGVLFSTTGKMAQSSISVVNATLLAIDQINQNGGIDHKRIVPVVYDTASVWDNYAKLAEKLIVEDRVQVIFGGWSSAGRKVAKPIIEKYDNLLIYPAPYEGVEESNNIIYLGATPNQQIVPAVAWFLKNQGKKAIIVGSNTIYSHVSNEILAHEVQMLGGQVVNIDYISLNNSNVDAVITNIIKQQPDVVFNTITGSTNITFFKRLAQLTQTHHRPVVMSFRLSSADMQKIGMEKIIGDYAVWTYFITQTNAKNIEFLQAYKEKYGTVSGINDPAISAYTGVYLWADALRHAPPKASPRLVRDELLRTSIASPAGVIYIDPASGNAWRTVMIGQIDQHGFFKIIWSSINPISPIVYPEFKSRAEWDLFEYRLYLKWGKSWENTPIEGNGN